VNPFGRPEIDIVSVICAAAARPGQKPRSITASILRRVAFWPVEALRTHRRYRQLRQSGARFMYLHYTGASISTSAPHWCELNCALTKNP